MRRGSPGAFFPWNVAPIKQSCGSIVLPMIPSGTTACSWLWPDRSRLIQLFVTQDDLALRIAGLRPGETSFLQPLGTNPESGSVPDDNLQPIALSVAEWEPLLTNSATNCRTSARVRHLGLEDCVFAVIQQLQHRHDFANRCVGQTLTFDLGSVFADVVDRRAYSPVCPQILRWDNFRVARGPGRVVRGHP